MHTGAQYRERQGLSALREQVRAGAVDVILVYALDRLSRNQAHVYILAEEIEQYGARLDVVTEVFEDSAVGRFIRSAKAFAAEVEREKTSERTTRGKQARVASGRPLPGPRPLFGYQWIDDSRSALKHDPVTSVVVRRIFEMASKGSSLTGIGRALMADDIPTPTGKPIWRATTIRHILSHPGYKGIGYGWAWRGAHGKKHRVIDMENAILLPSGTYPALVTEREWDTVQDRIARNKAEAIRNNRNPEETLLRAGFVFCGYCGRKMHVKKAARGPEYKCVGAEAVSGTCEGMPSIRAQDLDTAVWEKVCDVLIEPDRIAREVRRMQANDPTIADLAAIDRSLRASEMERSNYLEAIGAMQQPDAIAAVAERLEETGKRIARLNEEREAVLDRRRAWQLTQDRLDDLTLWCGRVAANVQHMTYQEQRDTLTALGVTARAYRANHEPRYEIRMNIPVATDIANRSSR